MFCVPCSVTCLRRLRPGLLHTQLVAVSAHLFGSKARTRTAAKKTSLLLPAPASGTSRESQKIDGEGWFPAADYE